MAMGDGRANFLHLGPGKSGSTWLHEVLGLHPQVYLADAKDLYFFSRYYDRGDDWYHAQFRGAGSEHTIVGEVSPDYLPCPEAAERIHACLGTDVRLMVTLREPADRAFSAYLYLQKHGLAAPTFRETVKTTPELLDEGRYASQLRQYLRFFPQESICITLFDDLQVDPQAYLDGVTSWLGIARQQLAPELLEAKLPASKARWLPLAAVAKRGAGWVRSHDGAEIVGRIKRSALVRRVLYIPLGADRPVMSAEDVEFVRGELWQEVALVEEDFGIPLRQRWGW
jgi:Sulfotransferase domain